jgi:hypothetical protein
VVLRPVNRSSVVSETASNYTSSTMQTKQSEVTSSTDKVKTLQESLLEKEEIISSIQSEFQKL